VLLFVILISCLIMTWSMISNKNKLAQIKGCEEDEPLNTDEEINKDNSADIIID
jgi:hypothetical protein